MKKRIDKMQQHNQSSDVKISREIDMQSTYVYFYQQQCRFLFFCHVSSSQTGHAKNILS